MSSARLDYLSNSVTEYMRNSEGLAQQKGIEKLEISGLPSYEEATTDTDKVVEKPPPYSLHGHQT